MTRLDKAFIKAYSKSVGALPGPHIRMNVEPARTAHVPPAAPPAALAPKADVPAPERLVAGSPTAVQSSIVSPPPCEIGRHDCQHVIQSPHWAAQAGIAAFARWDGAAPPAIEPVFSPKPVIEPAPAPPPAEAPAAPANISAVAETPPPPPNPLRAAFEVDNFLWPAMCRKLTAAATAAWNQLAGELAASARQGQQIVLITSHCRGEGRTMLAVCLAQLLAQQKVRVALVDADFQRPQLAGQLKLLPAAGWDEVARADEALTESWIESLADGVTLLPLRSRPDSTGLTGNPRVKATLKLLREQHDLVLIDAGSLDDSNDREMLALLAGTAQVDAALVVRDVRSGTPQTLADCQQRLDTLGITRWDVVENFV